MYVYDSVEKGRHKCIYIMKTTRSLQACYCPVRQQMQAEELYPYSAFGRNMGIL